MTGFVISHEALAALAHHPVLLLGTNHDALDGVTDLVVADFSELSSCGQDGGLIEKIGKISTGVTRGTTGHFVEVNVLGKCFATGMDSRICRRPRSPDDPP